jgi:hypothetical protein
MKTPTTATTTTANPRNDLAVRLLDVQDKITLALAALTALRDGSCGEASNDAAPIEATSRAALEILRGAYDDLSAILDGTLPSSAA